MTNLEKVLLLNTVGVDYHVYYHYKKKCFICLSMDEAKRYKNIIEVPYIENCQTLIKLTRYKEMYGKELSVYDYNGFKRATRHIYVTEEDIENIVSEVFDCWEQRNNLTIDWDTVIGL